MFNGDVSMRHHLKHSLLVLLLALLSGCVYLPRTTTTYNTECQTQQRQMRLEAQQLGTLMGCQGEACTGALIAFGAVSAATAIVSGSIVLVGNMVYWLEERGQCNHGPRQSSSNQATR